MPMVVDDTGTAGKWADNTEIRFALLDKRLNWRTAGGREYDAQRPISLPLLRIGGLNWRVGSNLANLIRRVCSVNEHLEIGSAYGLALG